MEQHPLGGFADLRSSKTTQNVFSRERSIAQPVFANIDGLRIDQKQKMDGLSLLAKVQAATIPLVFFDPQYRAILDKQKYGNEGKGRGRKRSELPQMGSDVIADFLTEIERVLIPSGHLMLWVDKFIVGNGINGLLGDIPLKVVDLITWNKQRMGMGYRTRRFSEHLVVLQKPPIRAKGVWRVHNIPDVWSEKIENGDRNHTHAKPVELQKRLIEAVTNEGDIVVDPAAGGYSVLASAIQTGRHFLGCDILG
ncbi:MAG: site-specific DNA-methyltransferase [Anaerolineales bacterium]